MAMRSIEIRFKTTEEMRDRLRHQSKRLGMDMNDIVREGTIARLDELEEQEALAIERKRAARSGAPMPSVRKPKSTAPVPPMFKLPTLSSFLPKTIPASIPEKITKSFKRWAEFIDDAEDNSDGERRGEMVLKDLREKCGDNEEIYKVSLDAFKEMLENRKEAAIVDAGDVKVEGDV